MISDQCSAVDIREDEVIEGKLTSTQPLAELHNCINTYTCTYILLISFDILVHLPLVISICVPSTFMITYKLVLRNVYVYI